MAKAIRTTLDTNVLFYALTINPKTNIASRVLEDCDFLSVQALNEYANAAVRKRERTLAEVSQDIDALTKAMPYICSVELAHHRSALKIAARYRLSFYDSLMIAVALENDAAVLYSEDMQHGLVIDGTLTITNPFLPTDAQ